MNCDYRNQSDVDALKMFAHACATLFGNIDFKLLNKFWLMY